MRTMTSLYQGVCSCKIIQYCSISIIWSWKTIMFSLWTKRSEQCIHTSYNYFVLFQLPGVIWYMRIFYLTIAALVCASKRLNNDNSCLHLVNFCDETTRIDWYGELFFSQSLTCGKSVIIVASCCNPGHLRSLFRLVVYNYIVLFVIVINKTTTTDITPNPTSPNRPRIFSGYLWRLCTIKRIPQQVQPITLQKPHCSLALCMGLSLMHH